MQDMKNDNEIEINLEELVGLILHRLWLILLCGVLTGVVGFGVSAFLIAPKYESTTGIYVMSKQDNGKLSYSDAQLSAQLTKDYEELINSRYVLESVIQKCNLEYSYEQLLSRVSIRNATDTRIIYITVKDEDPALAQFVANSIREVASEHIKSVTDVEAVNVVDQANYPDKPSEPSIPKWTIVGALIGLLLCTAVVIIHYLADDTVKTSEDVEKYLGWGTLAIIPVIEDNVSGKSVSKKSSGQKSTAASVPQKSENMG